MITGELSLDGSVLPVKGVLPIAIKAREMGFKRLIVPMANVTGLPWSTVLMFSGWRIFRRP